MNAKRTLLGTALVMASLVGATALTACGSNSTQTKSADGSVTLTSLPAAQVSVDGLVKGNTPLTLNLPSGNHKVVLKADGFEDFSQTVTIGSGITTNVDFSLTANDREDPRVIGLLAKDLGFEVPPAEEIQVHRGAAKESLAVILWPVGDVRKTGLSTFRLDVSDSYKDNGVLRFKEGKKVLYERAFSPEQLVTWEPIPAEVISGVSKGDKITWGLFFDGAKAPKDIVATFEVVDRPQVDAAMSKIDTNKAYQRQDALSRELLKGETLQNYRLYTEAMAKYVEILLADPDSWLPFRGMVASLRRMGAEESSLYAELAQFVTGKGGNATGGGDTGLGTIPNGLKMGDKPTLVTHNENVARAAEKAKYGGAKVGPATTAPVEGAEAPTAEATPENNALEQLMMDARNAHLRLNAMKENWNAAKTKLSEMQNAVNAAEQAKKNVQEVAGEMMAAAATLKTLQDNPVDPSDPGYAAYAMALAKAQHAVSNLTTKLAQAQADAAAAIANAPNQSEMDQAKADVDQAKQAYDAQKHISEQLDMQLGAAGGVVAGDPNAPPTPPGSEGSGPTVAAGQHMTQEQIMQQMAQAQDRLNTFKSQADQAKMKQQTAQQAYDNLVTSGAPAGMIQTALDYLNQANQELAEANQKVQAAQAFIAKLLAQANSQHPH